MTAFANDVELIESLDLMAVRQTRRVQTNEFSQVLSPSIITLTPKISSARKQENLCQETKNVFEDRMWTRSCLSF